MRFDLGTLDSGERSLPFGLLVFMFDNCFNILLHSKVLNKTFSYCFLFLSCLLRQARHILDRFCFGLRLIQAPNKPAGYHSGSGTCHAKTILYHDISSQFFVRVIPYHFSGHLVLYFIKAFNSLMLFLYVSKFISCPVFMTDTDM